jgi:hypothetical protein
VLLVSDGAPGIAAVVGSAQTRATTREKTPTSVMLREARSESETVLDLSGAAGGA